MTSRQKVDPAKTRPTRAKKPKGAENVNEEEDEKPLKAPLGSRKYSKRIVHNLTKTLVSILKNSVILHLAL